MAQHQTALAAKTDRSYRRLPDTFRSRHFWIVAAMLVACTLLHYHSLLIRLPLATDFSHSRHSVERIIFLLPVAAAAFAFGWRGGLVTLLLAVLIMLPHIFLVSLFPIDSLFEMLAVAVVGGVLIWLVETQEKEKRLRQKLVEELDTLNSITTALTEMIHLDDMLERTLDRVVETVQNLEPRCAILLLDAWGQTLHLRAQRGLPPDFVQRAQDVPLGECICGASAESGRVLVVKKALGDPRHTRCRVTEPHAHICVPLISKRRLQGVMDFILFNPEAAEHLDLQLFASIGRQVGVAVENARLCENMRFYVRQITRAQEQERKRIARELHDDTAQGLVEVMRGLDVLAVPDQVTPEEMSERVDALQDRIQSLLGGVRRFSRDLRPSVLDDLGLLPALQGLVDVLPAEGIESAVEFAGEPRRLGSEVELELFRIVQESLNNVRRHSGATQVKVGVEFRPARVRIRVEDNGSGFELPADVADLVTMGKFGLVGIEERVQLLGGSLSILSGQEQGQGTMLVVEVPV